MKIINKKLSLKEFGKYVNDKDFGSLPPTFIVLHHTFVPTKKDWQGERTIGGIKSYYEGKGWTAGPHLFIAEDGIWLFTDMYDVGIHAGAGNGTLKSGYSIGIEVVGNYDNKVWEGKTYDNTVGAIKILQEKLRIPDKEIAFHRDYSSKSCPGWAITKDWVLDQLNENEMSNPKYHTASSLTKENRRIWEKFKADVEESHKKMAGKLHTFINEKKLLEKDVVAYKIKEENNEKALVTQEKKLESAFQKKIETIENGHLKNLEELVFAHNDKMASLEEATKLEIEKSILIVKNSNKEKVNKLNIAHDNEITKIKSGCSSSDKEQGVSSEEDGIKKTDIITSWGEWFKWAFRKVGIKTTDHEGM